LLLGLLGQGGWCQQGAGKGRAERGRGKDEVAQFHHEGSLVKISQHERGL
jgi:hypothetical protein